MPARNNRSAVDFLAVYSLGRDQQFIKWGGLIAAVITLIAGFTH
ncbi:hypothetical protein EV14_0628 [Prochlorococcus sp. MIT 0703]|nr:hypothetical protein EV12_1876 [Prochlorococcus sp. MIT 0701]KGG36218.1 hypothetical protein EV14_0628 [Prochlorococcus sp. MIT 0703]